MQRTGKHEDEYRKKTKKPTKWFNTEREKFDKSRNELNHKRIKAVIPRDNNNKIRNKQIVVKQKAEV